MVDLDNIITTILNDPSFRIAIFTAYNQFPDKWFRKEFLYADEAVYKTKFKWHCTHQDSMHSKTYIVGMQHGPLGWTIIDKHQSCLSVPPEADIVESSGG
jgi:hypothetical protein